MAFDAVAALADVQLFAGVERRQLERLARQFKERVFREGDLVTREGEQGTGFFVLAEGSATVSIGGVERGTLGPGDYFGEMALIDEGPRSATIVAATDLRCLGLTPWDFRAFVESHPAVAWSMLQLLARRLRQAQG